MFTEELSYDIYWNENGVSKGIRISDATGSAGNVAEYAQILVNQIATRENVTDLTVWHRYNVNDNVTSGVVS